MVFGISTAEVFCGNIHGEHHDVFSPFIWWVTHQVGAATGSAHRSVQGILLYPLEEHTRDERCRKHGRCGGHTKADALEQLRQMGEDDKIKALEGADLNADTLISNLDGIPLAQDVIDGGSAPYDDERPGERTVEQDFEQAAQRGVAEREQRDARVGREPARALLREPAVPRGGAREE